MKQNKVLIIILSYLLSSVLLLSSCGEAESSDANFSETLSEISSSDISKGNRESGSDEEFSNVENSGISNESEVYSRKILYNIGKEPGIEVGIDIEFLGRFYICNDSKHIEDYFDNSENDDAYYAVRFWGCYNNRLPLDKSETIEYFKSFGIECEEIYDMYFALVTEEQVNALSDDKNELRYILMSWCDEDEKEEYIVSKSNIR